MNTLAQQRPGWIDGLTPPPIMTVSEWADAKRVLNQRSSAENGPWRTQRTPYLRDIMDDLSDHSGVEEVTLMKGVQIGGTEAGNNWIGYIIDHSPAPFMVIQPTVDMGKRWSRQRLAPMIEDMPCLSAKIAPARSRDSGNTTLSKEFNGGLGIITGANSGSGLRSMPVKYLMKDELDAWPVNVDKEGDPSAIADARTTTYGRHRKILNISTPTEKETSRIWQKYRDGDQRQYHVPCPHCNEYQTLDLSKLKWQKNDQGEAMPDTVQCLCEHCGALIPEHNKTWMIENGRWIPSQAENKRHHSYHLPSFYSPLGWMSWREIVEKFIEAKRSRESLQVFTNLYEAMPFDDVTDKVDPHILEQRATDYPLGECQLGDLILTAGVDTQPDRFEVVTYAHNMTTSRAVDYRVLWGDPDAPETRQALDDYLMAPFNHPAGTQLTIQAAAIDSGGHNTQSIYDFCRLRKRRHVIATKGYSQRGKPIIGKPTKVDVTLSGKTLKQGAEVWMVGADTAKSMIFNRLHVTNSDADGYIHFSKHLPGEFYQQLTSERVATRYVNGHPVREWVKKPGVRNEVLDCTVLAMAAYHHLGLHRWRASQWQQLAAKIEPPTRDLFAQADETEQAAEVEQVTPRPSRKAPRARRPRGPGFVQGGMSNGLY
jgi:phage terminase large subunit GpA-like protein